MNNLVMKILVAIKRVQDYNIKVQPKSDGSDVDMEGVKMGVNPFDENAIEEAIRLKEKGVASEIVGVSIGASLNQDVLRQGLAMGVDKAILVETDKVLHEIFEKTLRMLTTVMCNGFMTILRCNRYQSIICFCDVLTGSSS